MLLGNAVVIETFASRTVARIAAALLEAKGIESAITADDAGGTVPMLQLTRGVRLLVAAEDAPRATQILASTLE